MTLQPPKLLKLPALGLNRAALGLDLDLDLDPELDLDLSLDLDQDLDTDLDLDVDLDPTCFGPRPGPKSGCRPRP